jgi:hypothetical protein
MAFFIGKNFSAGVRGYRTGIWNSPHDETSSLPESSSIDRGLGASCYRLKQTKTSHFPLQLLCILPEIDQCSTVLIIRTGDLVQQNKDGSLTYKCRRDTQIKLIGQRAEVA